MPNLLVVQANPAGVSSVSRRLAAAVVDRLDTDIADLRIIDREWPPNRFQGSRTTPPSACSCQATNGRRPTLLRSSSGHGDTPPLEVNTIATSADALRTFLADSALAGADLVGSSVGARLVLELARRGHGGAVVALDPGGFWENAGARYIEWTLGASVRAVGVLDRFLPTLAANPVTRSALLVQLSARPWRLGQEFALADLRPTELRSARSRANDATMQSRSSHGASTATNSQPTPDRSMSSKPSPDPSTIGS